MAEEGLCEVGHGSDVVKFMDRVFVAVVVDDVPGLQVGRDLGRRHVPRLYARDLEKEDVEWRAFTLLRKFFKAARTRRSTSRSPKTLSCRKENLLGGHRLRCQLATLVAGASPSAAPGPFFPSCPHRPALANATSGAAGWTRLEP